MTHWIQSALCAGSGCALLAAVSCASNPRPSTPAATPRSAFTITAYCRGNVTASGDRVRRGVVAADPAMFPLGSVVRISGLRDRHDGVYTVLDTGPAITGRRIDLYMPNCRDAVKFGRRSAFVTRER